VVVDGTLVLQLDTDSESFAAGLDSLTGETRWKMDRDKSAIWASPALFRSSKNSVPQVILQSKKSLLSIDHRTGKENWKVEQACAEIASTTVAGDLLVAPLKKLTVLRPNQTAEIPEVLWSDVKLSPDTPTPVVYKDKVYVLKGAILSCADLKTGNFEWRMRLDSTRASSSPLAGDGHLYLVDESGVLQTVQLDGEKGEVDSRVELGEKIMATPALSGGALYLRSDKHLWKFANAN
jgi:outer membrane protein assembly factor BamB